MTSVPLMSLFGRGGQDLRGAARRPAAMAGRWLSLIHPDDRASVAGAAEAALHGGPRYDVEYRVVRPDGTERWSTARVT